ncbi:unnamed protein product [Fraxinus pennsylvanica]|uniref:PGG domain-containing protein n=1 Tax=Fraxinus pennsylvanica TaxID=56036 RepID=A0AAD1ZP02_9LAMI|nr:unnamed protein product [Fraxinus pennsylvanica]
MRTYESEPELGSDEQSELSREDSYPPLDTNIYEAQVLNMHNQIEIEVESPISNANAQHFNDHRRNVKSLHKAVLRGDWKAAKTALSLDKNIARIEITERGDRALHIAAAAKQTAFVQNLVEHLNTSDLELQNRHGNTAFCIAAASGVVEIAKVMYEKNKNLPSIRSSIGKIPLEMAIVFGNREMVEYLYPITPLEVLNAEENKDILKALVHIDMYDIALEILNSSRIDISTTNVGRALQALARKPLRGHGFRGHWMWERLVRTFAYIPWNVEFLTLLTDSYPDLFWEVNKEYHSIFHVALINRQEKVFNLIYQIGAVRNLITLYKDQEGNNILHLAGKLAPPSRLKIVSGAALQMQRELQWFKEVEKIVPSSFLHMKNKDKLTPRELFSKEHEALRKEGEEWMKRTVSFCLVVATLIATVAFDAGLAIFVGNNQESGTSILLKDRQFKIFVIYNALAMFSSTTSIMIYLSILISPFVEDDFQRSLTTKLVFGLSSVLASLGCMVVTFSATVFSVYNKENQWPLQGLVFGIALLTSIIYTMIYYKLWNTRVFSTGWPA